MADWTLIPDELLAVVLQKLPFIVDYVHFSAVCKSWNNVARKERYQQLPLLLVPAEDGSKEKLCLYNVIDNVNTKYQVNVCCNSRCCGSSLGCLFFAAKTSFIISKPFSGNEIIELPPMIIDVPEDEDDSFCISNVKKAVVSCDPFLYPKDFEVAVIYGEMLKLAIFRAGDENWTTIEDTLGFACYYDVIYYKGAFYAIDRYMGLRKINASGNELERSYQIDLIVPELSALDLLDAKIGLTSLFHLIESSGGDLICASRMMGYEEDEEEYEIIQLVTSCFKIFKLEKVTQGYCSFLKWIEIDTLDGNALFLGVNHSMAINVGTIFGCQPNCIYDTDDVSRYTLLYELFDPRDEGFCPCDAGIFNLETRRFESPFHIGYFRMHPAVWIVPSLKGF